MTYANVGYSAVKLSVSFQVEPMSNDDERVADPNVVLVIL